MKLAHSRIHTAKKKTDPIQNRPCSERPEPNRTDLAPSDLDISMYIIIIIYIIICIII